MMMDPPDFTADAVIILILMGMILLRRHHLKCRAPLSLQQINHLLVIEDLSVVSARFTPNTKIQFHGPRLECSYISSQGNETVEITVNGRDGVLRFRTINEVLKYWEWDGKETHAIATRDTQWIFGQMLATIQNAVSTITREAIEK